ncbi:MAG: NUDIX hydrolase [Actinomycetales bacterium]|nr:NUDIX hydrolase [Actinomycetales bacterium]
MIKASGGVVWRRNYRDEVEIALVHRPKYNDWSLPKGKRESHEESIACAFREILEETGFHVRLSKFLGTTFYETPEGAKSVDYWAAKYVDERAVPNPFEIDQVKWVSLTQVNDFQLRSTDREIIHKFRSIELDTSALILLRHAKAISREEWESDDGDRPLANFGTQQSRRLIANLTPYDVREIHTSSAVRCYETVTPLARALDIGYIFSDKLSEYEFERNQDSAYEYVKGLLRNDVATVICSHNPILPTVLSRLYAKSGFELPVTKLEPGDAWVVHHLDREVISVDYLSAPTI